VTLALGHRCVVAERIHRHHALRLTINQRCQGYIEANLAAMLEIVDHGLGRVEHRNFPRILICQIVRLVAYCPSKSGQFGR
jgi:hypothetical protein